MVTLSDALLSTVNNTGTTKSGSSSKSNSTFGTNYEMFLSLLTTQLKNQNPLEPLSVEDFTKQLTEFSGIEQQTKTNSLLEQLIGQANTNATTAAIGYLNNDVTAKGSTSPLKNGEAEWTLNSDKASLAQISVRNAEGALVYMETKALTQGAQAFKWNGRSQNGVALPEGNYSLSIQAADATGQPVSVSTNIKGRVTGVEFNEGEPTLIVGGTRLKLADITSISVPNNI